MLAGLVTGPHVVSVEDVALPKPADDVLVRVSRAGICGTDLKIVSGAVPVTYPRILGHEIVGVVESSDAVSPVVPGTRVIVDPVTSCGECEQCQAGKRNLCGVGGLLGRDQDGGLAELIRVDPRQLHLLPETVADDEAPLIQVLATCIHAQNLVDVNLGKPAVVVGLGVTGLLHAQILKARGASPVVGITRSARKRALALDLGVDCVAAPDGAHDLLAESTSNGRSGLVIECVGAEATFALAVAMAAPGGEILSYGTITSSTLTAPFYEIYHRELRVLGARASVPSDFPSAVAVVSRGAVQLAPLISRKYPLAEVEAALRAAESPDVLKVIVECS